MEKEKIKVEEMKEAILDTIEMIIDNYTDKDILEETIKDWGIPYDNEDISITPEFIKNIYDHEKLAENAEGFAKAYIEEINESEFPEDAMDEYIMGFWDNDIHHVIPEIIANELKEQIEACHE